LSSTSSPKKADWVRRVNRAEDLAEQYPSAREVLNFYAHILEFQKAVYDGIAALDESAGNGANLRQRLDLNAAARHFPVLLTLVRRTGPAKIAQEAERLQGASDGELREMLLAQVSSLESSDREGSFFARVILQPYAESLAQVSEPSAATGVGNRCPQCGGAPQLTVIRQEGDGGKRSMVCSFCLTEWEFRRIWCPACGEEHNEKLPRYSAQGIAAVRVEACDTCRNYLKSVDMTIDGFAVPIVDEIATTVLDLWAVERGYQKLQLNIVGF
jgi:FdhE protein